MVHRHGIRCRCRSRQSAASGEDQRPRFAGAALYIYRHGIVVGIGICASTTRHEGWTSVPLNIVHRDISPPNILMSFQGEVKLTDFGIASASHKALETEVGIVKGRYDYMSPEQARGRSWCRSTSFLWVWCSMKCWRDSTHFAWKQSWYIGPNTFEDAHPLCRQQQSLQVRAYCGTCTRDERNERYATAKVLREALDEFFMKASFYLITVHWLCISRFAYGGIGGYFPTCRPQRPVQ